MGIRHQQLFQLLPWLRIQRKEDPEGKRQPTNGTYH